MAQTHASSPRCSAYLAAQLRELSAVLKATTPAAPATPELGRLVVFGAGDKYDFDSGFYQKFENYEIANYLLTIVMYLEHTCPQITVPNVKLD